MVVVAKETIQETASIWLHGLVVVPSTLRSVVPGKNSAVNMKEFMTKK